MPAEASKGTQNPTAETIWLIQRTVDRTAGKEQYTIIQTTAEPPILLKEPQTPIDLYYS